MSKPNGADLYIIQSAVTGVIKIGRSKDVGKRLSQLQTGCPYKLRLILHLPDQGHLETRLHRELRRWQIRWNGEWFKEEALPSLPDWIYDQIDPEQAEWWMEFSYARE